MYVFVCAHECDSIGENSSFTILSYYIATRRIVRFFTRLGSIVCLHSFYSAILGGSRRQVCELLNLAPKQYQYYCSNLSLSFFLFLSVCRFVFSYFARVKQSTSILHVCVRHFKRTRDPCRRYNHTIHYTCIHVSMEQYSKVDACDEDDDDVDGKEENEYSDNNEYNCDTNVYHCRLKHGTF